METGLSSCAMKIHDKVDELRKTPEGRKQIMPMMEHYYGDRYKSIGVTDFVKLHNNSPMEDVYGFKVGSYSSFTTAQVQQYMSELGVPTEAKIEVPEADVTDWKTLNEMLSPEEVENIRTEMSGKFTTIDKPLSYGYVYLERLYHQPQYSGKVVSDLEDVSGRGKQPIAGHGLYRKNGGQKIGEICIKTVSKTQELLERTISDQHLFIQQRGQRLNMCLGKLRRYSLALVETLENTGKYGLSWPVMQSHSYKLPVANKTVKHSRDSLITSWV